MPEPHGPLMEEVVQAAELAYVDEGFYCSPAFYSCLWTVQPLEQFPSLHWSLSLILFYELALFCKR